MRLTGCRACRVRLSSGMWTCRIRSRPSFWAQKPGAAASRGFGFDIIRAMVEDQLEGRIVLDWLAEGLRCLLQIPVRFILPPRSA